MSDLVRFGVAMERELLADFDRRIAERGYENRSEGINNDIATGVVVIAAGSVNPNHIAVLIVTDEENVLSTHRKNVLSVEFRNIAEATGEVNLSELINS